MLNVAVYITDEKAKRCFYTISFTFLIVVAGIVQDRKKQKNNIKEK